MVRSIAVLFFTLITVGSLSAQISPSRTLRVSPYAFVSQTVGITEMSVSYHRPGVKGRAVWNALVPYGQVWRAGANNATVFSFSDDVTINGSVLKAGKYSFFAVPGEQSWTLIFNAQADQWGAYSYDSTKNVLTFTAVPVAAPHEEWLSYSFSDLNPNSATVTLRWEKLAVPFTVSTNTSANGIAAETNLRNQAAGQAASAARFALDTKSDYENGLQAADRAIALNPSWNNLSLKAQLLAAQEKFADAVKTGESALDAGKKANGNTAGLEKMLADWKAKLPAAKGKKK